MSNTKFLAHSGKYANILKMTTHKHITVQDLKKPNEYYEIIGTYLKKVEEGEVAPEPINLKAFIDLDGTYDGNKEEFEELNEKIRNKLMNYEPIIGLRESSMYEAKVYQWNKKESKDEFKGLVNKLSFTITYRKMTPCLNTMENYIITEELPKLQHLLHGIIDVVDKKVPNALNIDRGVYAHHKIRCPNAYKEKAQPERISRVLKGDIQDNIIQIVDDTYEVIPKNEIVEKAKVQKKEKKEQKEKKEKKEKEEESEEESETLKVVKRKTEFTDIEEALCNGISKRFYDYDDWIKIMWVFKNEGWSQATFDELSKKHGKDKYNKNYNEDLWNSSNKDGLTVSTLWHFLKVDNHDLFKKLQSNRKDFYKMLELQCQNLDLAILYYNLQPTKYAYSPITKWWEYRMNNILVNTGKEEPTSLINNIGSTLREYFNEQRGLLDMEDKEYKERNEAINKVYANLGKSSFCKGIIDFLKHYYTFNEFETLVDANTNILAWNNMLYDIDTNTFRSIQPSDYISRTCGYNLNKTSVAPIRQHLKEIIDSIFPDKATRDYYLKITALSFFFNKYESFYVLTGKGRNGKGVLDKVIKKGLGAYHYTAESTFLTSQLKAGVPNPTFVNTNGVRYLSVSEPDNGSENCTLNVEFVKSITGRDDITTRGLYKDNITFKNTFSTFLQCNNKPTLNKLDKAIVERLKCIPFTERFISNPDPTDPHQHEGDDNLKDLITTGAYVNEFMLWMLEIAHQYKDMKKSDFKPSDICNESTNEYVEENNAFKFWFNKNYKRIVIPDNFKTLSKEERDKFIVRIKTSTILSEYNADKAKNEQMTAKKLRLALAFNDIEVQVYVGTPVIKGYEKVKDDEEEEENIIDDLDK